MHWRTKLSNRITAIILLPFILIFVLIAVIKGAIRPHATVTGELKDWLDAVDIVVSAIVHGNKDVF